MPFILYFAGFLWCGFMFSHYLSKVLKGSRESIDIFGIVLNAAVWLEMVVLIGKGLLK